METTVPMVPWVLAEMAAVLGDQDDRFDRFLGQFRRTMAICIADLRFEASAGDMSSAARVARLLESASRPFGAERLAQLCARIEAKALDAGFGPDEGLLAEIEMEAARVRVEIVSWRRARA